jgi:uncharacterized protein YjiS (DUF1127 family)
MAAFERTRSAPFGATSGYNVIQFVSNALGMVKDWNDARVTRKALSTLSDRELDDIGLCRGDIDHIG